MWEGPSGVGWTLFRVVRWRLVVTGSLDNYTQTREREEAIFVHRVKKSPPNPVPPSVFTESTENILVLKYNLSNKYNSERVPFTPHRRSSDRRYRTTACEKGVFRRWLRLEVMKDHRSVPVSVVSRTTVSGGVSPSAEGSE